MIEGIIFDMDGVISDTQKLHSRVESELLARCGVQISPEEITQRYSGVKTREFFEDLLQDSMNVDLDALIQEKWEKMKGLASYSVDTIDGCKEIIEYFYNNNYALGVASASNLSYVDQVLSTLKIKEKFRAIIAGDMVSKGKPDPEIFLLAASKIGINPKKCLVIEDGKSGMHAARAAKMYCIGLVKDIHGNYPTKNLVLSLREITREYLRQLVLD